MDFKLSDWTHEELTLEGAFGIDFEIFKKIVNGQDNRRFEIDDDEVILYENMYTYFHKLFLEVSTYPSHYVVLLDSRSRVLYELFYVIILEEAQAEEKEKLKGIEDRIITSNYFSSHMEYFQQQYLNNPYFKIIFFKDYVSQKDPYDVLPNNVVDFFDKIHEVEGFERTSWKDDSTFIVRPIFQQNKFYLANLTIKPEYKVLPSKFNAYINRSNFLIKNIPLSYQEFSITVIFDKTNEFPIKIDNFVEEQENMYFYSFSKQLPLAVGIRKTKNKVSSKDSIEPFIFFDNLTKTSKQVLIDCISKRWKFWNKSLFPQDSRNELGAIIFFLGASLLKCFLEKLDCKFTNVVIDTLKLYASFNCINSSILKELFDGNDLFCEYELVDVLNKAFNKDLDVNSTSNINTQLVKQDVREYFFDIASKNARSCVYQLKGEITIEFIDRFKSINNILFELRRSLPYTKNHLYGAIIEMLEINEIEEIILLDNENGYLQGFRTTDTMLFMLHKKYYYFTPQLVYLEEINLGDMEWAIEDLKEYYNRLADFECYTDLLNKISFDDLDNYIYTTRYTGLMFEDLVKVLSMYFEDDYLF